MKKNLLTLAVFTATTTISFSALDPATIDEITGLKGKLNEKEGADARLRL